ncbi:MAG: DUF2029 domain-containing protein [Calditrichaeota bacterium]|nr:MAG: DUF2029 domain-containing protein [Calditrichota bacterium]
MIGLLMLAGLAYWLAVWRGRSQQGLPALSVVFAVGLLMRLLMWPTTPILEVDFNRYLWDGAVSAHGLHPYRYAPEQIGRHPEQVPPAYRQLAREGAPVLARINHAYLTSIYPPVTQLFFALAHRLAPWKLAGWRAVLLAMDLLSFVLLVALLRQLNRPPAWSLIYWWNPLLIKELFNSAHMEGLLFPFLLAALLALLRRRENLALLLLALATGIKLWPALLLPLFLRAWQGRWGRRALQAAGFAALSLLLLWPLLGTPEQASGLANYTTRWELNDALFPWFVKSWAALLPHWGIHPGWAQQWARVTVGILVGLTALLVAVPPIHRPGQLVRRALVVVAVLFFLSPTQFPWYALWLLPLLVLEPVPALLLLTVTLPLYYGRYWLAARGLEGWFDAWGVWLEFGPVLLWLGYEWLSGRLGWLKRRGPAVPGLEVPDAQ